MKLCELGERSLVEKLIKVLDKEPNVLLPYGDDAAALEVDGVKVVLSCDMLVWDTDVPEGMSFWEAGRKAVVSCISDLAAKGAKPIAVLASLGLPRDLEVEKVLELMKGVNDGAREYGSYVVGGDTNEAPSITVDVMALGLAVTSPVARGGAKPGDILAVTGPFGSAAAALTMYKRGLKPSSEDLRRKLWEALTKPKARLKEGLALARFGVASSSIDSSDGLAISLSELSRASHVGFNIDWVPISNEAVEFAREFGLDPLDLALYGGEEFELVLTIPPEKWSLAEKAITEVGGKLFKIGTAIPDIKITLKSRGALEIKGWEHMVNQS